MARFNRHKGSPGEGSPEFHQEPGFRLRSFIFLCIAALALMGVAALGAFFFSIQGAEQTMVPDVRGKELGQGLLELQVKELYPRIQLQYSQSQYDKGLILEQDPAPGAIVRAGRRIRLVVSQGVVLNTVSNYLGQNVDEVKLDLRTLFAAADQPLLSLVEPFMYAYSPEAAGTILEQSPEPGSPLTGPTELNLVVSRGPEHRTVQAPAITGLSPRSALEKIDGSGVSFSFSIRTVRENESAGIVVYQDPAAGTMIESNRRVSLLVTIPAEIPADRVYGLFKYSLPENPYPLPVRLEALVPGSEERSLLAGIDFIGGEFSFPYDVPPSTILILSQMGREIYRETIEAPVPTRY
ncbi:MAG: PASTA domain-containing protein [Treponema sp.]|jgi:beta-lactam-binding protein with PASTA domain|nr:PASTA domain-containing protein [Treponema sp.]